MELISPCHHLSKDRIDGLLLFLRRLSAVVVEGLISRFLLIQDDDPIDRLDVAKLVGSCAVAAVANEASLERHG